MGTLVFVTGVALMQGYFCLMKKVNSNAVQSDFSLGHVFFAGILACTLYAQIFSLFYRVNLEANVLLIIVSLLCTFWQREFLAKQLKNWMAKAGLQGRSKVIVIVLVVVVVIAFALTSAGAVKLIDTDWYHAQTIHWIEEYGCVKGVANLFYALGFNNAQHYLDALFSMKCFFSQSLRGTGGFFSLVIFFHGASRVYKWKKHEHHVADILAVWEMAYSIIVTAFNTEVYVDTLPNILVLFILTEWFALLEEKSEDTIWYGFYSLLAVFAVVCKTSVVMIVLLSAYPVYLLIKQKKKSQILIYLGIGFLIVFPWLITNVRTTGYLVYLFSGIDFFHVPWKIAPEVLKYSVDNMIASARNPSWPMAEVLNCGLAWVESWWSRESISHQILYIGIVIFVVYDFIRVARDLIRKKNVDFAYLWPRVCMYAGLVYWFFTIPQVKYCWAFLIFPVAFVPGFYWERESKTWINKGLLLLGTALLIMYSAFYGVRTLGYMKDGLVNYPVMQADYHKYVLGSVEINGHTFYKRIENGDTVSGYYNFPFLDNGEEIEQLVIKENLREGIWFEK